MVRTKKVRRGYIAPFYKRPGGTTGRPRVERKPPKPLVSIDLLYNRPTAIGHPGPAHGVSGFQNTGIGGQFNAVRSTTGINHPRTADPSASRFNMEVSGAADRVRNSYVPTRPPPPPYMPPGRSGRNYIPIGTPVPSRPPPPRMFGSDSNYRTPPRTGGPPPYNPTVGSSRPTRMYPVQPPATGGPPPYSPFVGSGGYTSPFNDYGTFSTTTIPVISKNTRDNDTPTTYGAFTSEPTFEHELEGVAAETAPYGLARHQRLQAQRNPYRRSSLDRQAERGYYSGDTFMQENLPMLDRGRATNIAHGDIITPQRPLRLQFSPTPSTNPRNASDHQGSGTINNVASINVQTPVGQSTLPVAMDQTTPGVGTVGYSSVGNHFSFGPPGGPTPGVDGSWTLNIMPGQAQPTLATLAPAADIPIRNNGPGQLGNTSLFATNRGGTGRLSGRMM